MIKNNKDDFDNLSSEERLQVFKALIKEKMRNYSTIIDINDEELVKQILEVFTEQDLLDQSELI